MSRAHGGLASVAAAPTRRDPRRSSRAHRVHGIPGALLVLGHRSKVEESHAQDSKETRTHGQERQCVELGSSPSPLAGLAELKEVGTSHYSTDCRYASVLEQEQELQYLDVAVVALGCAEDMFWIRRGNRTRARPEMQSRCVKDEIINSSSVSDPSPTFGRSVERQSPRIQTIRSAGST